LDFLDDPEERDDVNDLLNWWNWWVHPHQRTFVLADSDYAYFYSQVFPSYVKHERGVTKKSALARLKEKRAQMQAQNAGMSGTA
jgi:hypothetical protein